MRRQIIGIVTPLLVAACGRANAPSPADSAAAAKQVDDSVLALHTREAPLLADSARRTLATLLKQPASAVFDSLVVMQPAQADGAWPPPVVCGRIGGRPGLDGRQMTPFIYQNRLDVFVLQKDNGPAFNAMRAKTCGDPSARLLLGAAGPGTT